MLDLLQLWLVLQEIVSELSHSGDSEALIRSCESQLFCSRGLGAQSPVALANYELAYFAGELALFRKGTT